MATMTSKRKLYEPISFYPAIERPLVDEWVPSEEDFIFSTVKGAIMADISSFYGMVNNPNLDSFYLKSKRSYNNQKVRDHMVQYLNYFEKYFDPERELLSIYATIKYLIDYEPYYGKDAFFFDIKRYIIHGPIAIKADYMNEHNYCLSLTYRNKKNPALQYLDKHAKLLMKISLLMNMMAPLLCHYMCSRQIKNSSDFLMEIYDDLFHIDPNIDIYSKLYETAESNVEKAAKDNPGIFSRQDIRGINVTVHSESCVRNIALNIIIKYLYSSKIRTRIVVIQYCNFLNCWKPKPEMAWQSAAKPI